MCVRIHAWALHAACECEWGQGRGGAPSDHGVHTAHAPIKTLLIKPLNQPRRAAERTSRRRHSRRTLPVQRKSRYIRHVNLTHIAREAVRRRLRAFESHNSRVPARRRNVATNWCRTAHTVTARHSQAHSARWHFLGALQAPSIWSVCVCVCVIVNTVFSRPLHDGPRDVFVCLYGWQHTSEQSNPFMSPRLLYRVPPALSHPTASFASDAPPLGIRRPRTRIHHTHAR